MGKYDFPLNILLVDDDKNICKTLELGFESQGHQAKIAHGIDEAIALLLKFDFDLIVTDYKMDKKTGLELISEAKKFQPQCLIIVMTAFSSIENAVEVLREGAFDYLSKPFTQAQLFHSISKARQFISLTRENSELKNKATRNDFFSGYTSHSSLKLEEFVRAIAPTDATVLISGESGTGKTELAGLIHDLSPRRLFPFVTVCCTTLTESLIESELFGHIRGAFTGALKDKTGKLEIAHGGTLLLDEIGDLSLNGQAKLLRFLQEKVFEKVGSNKSVVADARIITATNKNLKKQVSSGEFREDLYYRLNSLECYLQPLRKRPEDIKIYMGRIIQELTVKYKRDRSWELPQDLENVLINYSWPGNIRELKNALERLMIFSKMRPPRLDDLPPEMISAINYSPFKTDDFLSLDEMEKNHIKKILSSENNFEAASRKLGISSVTLWKKRKAYGLL